MLLAIDAGNSFVKLAYHDGTAWLAPECIALGAFADAAARLGAARRPDAIVISNVAGASFRMPMMELLARWGCGAHWVTAPPRGCGVVNGYALPAQLGSDRWAGLVAARQLTGRAAVVTSVGTAATVDVLSAEGVFRGGLILPGVDLMQATLRQGTADLAAADGAYEKFPTSTANAMYTGALLAIAGAVERMVEAVGQASAGIEVILTGGGAETVAPFIRPAPRVIPNLVLDGLRRIAREEGLV